MIHGGMDSLIGGGMAGMLLGAGMDIGVGMIHGSIIGGHIMGIILTTDHCRRAPDQVRMGDMYIMGIEVMVFSRTVSGDLAGMESGKMGTRRVDPQIVIVVL